MGEGILFNVGAVTAITSSMALLVLRSPLKIVLAAFCNVLGFMSLLFALNAPIFAFIQFTVMMFLLAGAIQFVRAIGAARLYTRRSLSFVQVTGLLVSVLFGGLILLHMSSLLPDQTPLGASRNFDFVQLSSEGMTLVSLSGLLLFAALVALRFLLRERKERS